MHTGRRQVHCGNKAHAPMRGRTFACSLELVTEMPDGTYDFIPFLMDPVPPTPAGAPSARPA